MSDRGTGSDRPRGESAGPQERREEEAKSFFGLVACVVGLLIALGIVLVAVFSGGGGGVVSGGVIGIGLGALGYYLGASRLGVVTVIVSLVALFFGLFALQGYLPGVQSPDRELPNKEPAATNPAQGSSQRP